MTSNLNPFDPIYKELSQVQEKLDKLLNPPPNYLTKYYTVNESSAILRCVRATVLTRIKDGRIKCKPNTVPYLIPHIELFDSNNVAKKIKFNKKP